jgi:hypothetical protein
MMLSHDQDEWTGTWLKTSYCTSLSIIILSIEVLLLLCKGFLLNFWGETCLLATYTRI